MAAHQDEPGARMRAEIAQQPGVWHQALQRRAEFAEIAGRVAAARPRFVLLAARGTSDHAALYAKYLIEITLGLPAGLVSPSSLTAYGARPDLREVLLLAVSQSGGSPDLVQTVEAARSGGALTLAVTNNAASPLAAAAALHLDIGAGPERAVAATKSYTAQLLALYLLLDHWRGGTGAAAGALPAIGQEMMARAEREMADCAARYRFAQRLVVPLAPVPEDHRHGREVATAGHLREPRRQRGERAGLGKKRGLRRGGSQRRACGQNAATPPPTARSARRRSSISVIATLPRPVRLLNGHRQSMKPPVPSG